VSALPEEGRDAAVVRRTGLAAGLILAIGLQLLPVPEGLSREGWIVASLGLLMATWWATEAIPIPATSLLPLVILPLSGVLDLESAAAPFANSNVLLLMGGFIIALGLERSELHARIALNVVARAGGQPRALIFGFMVAAALISMWISNSATTLMLFPIALSVARAEAGARGMEGPFPVALLLAVAYAASIGGMATPVGTPPNLIAIGYLERNAGVSISFPQWIALGLPTAALLLPSAWLVLTRLALKVERVGAPGAAAEVRARLAALGRITTPEVRVGCVFAMVALAWIFRQPALDLVIAALESHRDALAAAGEAARAARAENAVAHWSRINGGQSDAVIAITGALALFLIPAGRGRAAAGEPMRGALMNWETAARLPWGVLLLYGGGLSLAAAINSTGLAEWLGGEMAVLAMLPPIVVALILVTVIVFLTELTSNAATVTAFMPVVGALALQGDIDPVLLAAPVAIAGSCAFMFPVATPPNAIVYGSGHVPMAAMMSAGMRLNLISIPIVTLTTAFLAPLVFG
jgi:sodium-dependent dicarboxylate transporter 2/3/5